MTIGPIARLIAPLLLAAGLLIAATPIAHALSLDEAKSEGLVGERPDGLLGVVVDTPETNRLVTEINAKRLDRYRQLAQEEGVPVNQVQALVGEKVIGQAAPGEYILGASGEWVRK